MQYNPLGFPKLKRGYVDWITCVDGTVAFTGSLKQARKHPNKIFEILDMSKAGKNVSRFIERSSRDVFGRSGVRKGRKLKFAGFVEGASNAAVLGLKRFHVHLCIGGVPFDFNNDDLQEILESRWLASEWGYNEVDIQSLDDLAQKKKWIGYCAKNFNPSETERFLTNVRFEHNDRF